MSKFVVLDAYDYVDLGEEKSGETSKYGVNIDRIISIWVDKEGQTWINAEKFGVLVNHTFEEVMKKIEEAENPKEVCRECKGKKYIVFYEEGVERCKYCHRCNRFGLNFE